ncbi:hypothetical protein GWG65_37655 [Bradyrhizobium sp. CSA207]|uniref:hypothetical protein n=1 Tax=Bradyrhizobium sp. CSA207 TaxID=2698826 RepID=UPI0023AEB375|nr:hypothetical protein [Bradyrhizobium sp. CSA207]MDE5446963.1 hypothetical protein [Bradyrhizobium sp. CSA207]
MSSILNHLITLRDWVTDEVKTFRDDPLSYLKSLGGMVWRLIVTRLGLLTRRNVQKRIFFSFLGSTTNTALLALLVFVLVKLDVSETLTDWAESLQPATIHDVHTVANAVRAYDDYVQRRARYDINEDRKERELFADVVRVAFPMKWESGLQTLTVGQTRDLSNNLPVYLNFRFRAFKGPPTLTPILKNLNFGRPADASSYITAKTVSCDISACRVELRWNHEPGGSRNYLQTDRDGRLPQVHWIATGEYPDDAKNDPPLPTDQENGSSQ